MAIIVDSITAQELIAGNTEGGSNRGPDATKSYLVEWHDRIPFANALLGFSSGSGPSSGIGFQPPHQHPEVTNAWAQRVTMRGVGKPSQGPKQIQFEKAIVTVNYGFPEFPGFNFATIDPQGQQSFDPATPFTYATQEFDFGGEYQTIPGSFCQFEDGTIIKERVTEFIGITKMNLTLHWMAYLPRNVLSYNGRTNDRTFLTGAPGKVRFEGARTSIAFQSDGSARQEVHLSFTYRDVAPWGFVRRKVGEWEEVLTQTADPIVERKNLMDLIPDAYKY